jgi:hypothetical protein
MRRSTGTGTGLVGTKMKYFIMKLIICRHRHLAPLGERSLIPLTFSVQLALLFELVISYSFFRAKNLTHRGDAAKLKS